MHVPSACSCEHVFTRALELLNPSFTLIITSDHPIARPLAASLSNEAAMSGIRPSLVDLPGDILKEIVETVARLSVSNRGADNEICSLSMVNKLFYELAIPHIFRVIRISRLRHFSLDGLYTGLPPVPLKYTM